VGEKKRTVGYVEKIEKLVEKATKEHLKERVEKSCDQE
jgi:hypothetical protein